jgi:adenylate cyclase class IV
VLATDYFDPKTHKGFLNKDLENRRRKLPASEKRWTWKKKIAEDVSGAMADVECAFTSTSAFPAIKYMKI